MIRNRLTPFSMIVLLQSFAVVAWLSSAAIAAPIIGSFDSSRAGDANIETSVHTTQAKDSLAAAFPGVAYAMTPTLTPEFLATIDILFLHPHTTTGMITPLSASEQTALFGFVAGGGNAVLLLEVAPGLTAGAQSMATPFGLTVLDDGVTGALTTTITAPNHPIFDGPFGTQASVAMGGAGYFSTLGPYAQSVATLNAVGQPVIAVIAEDAIAPGSGRVVLMGDTSPFINDASLGTFSAHQTLHSNMIAWLQPVPEPSSLLLAACGALAFAFVRRRKR